MFFIIVMFLIHTLFHPRLLFFGLFFFDNESERGGRVNMNHLNHTVVRKRGEREKKRRSNEAL